MNARTTLPSLTVGALLLLAACGSPAVEPPGLTASPSATATPPPTPEPTPTDGIQVHSDPAEGIVFENVPELTGDEAEVYNWIATYQKAYWETVRTNEPSSMIEPFTSAELQESLARLATNNEAQGFHVGGTFTTSIRDVAVSGDNATAVTCDDLREATFATDAGSFTPEEVGQGVPTRFRFELLRLDGDLWYINKIDKDGAC